ncbi:PREDICTED: caspase-3-like isoform X2 [Amphimedon queenslandica]|uniref:Caspase family p20 domain-containing protein n=1 Tax=Amphimedon queenslandica TaxID=400682 RepID=A0AAN0ISM6_AMPQE|nr:PREDICTED: caspase-3-like isoform X2 [Amphimedon queenslandica]|eukprot:XP_011408947.1 PREDICTED: caspase-3-like isoform X2 [Amphimedon queenslandica]
MEMSDTDSQSSCESPDSSIYQFGPGLCVIINNIVFHDPRNNLPSGVKDEASLNSTFTSLGFDVRVHQNKTAAEIGSIAREYSAMQHTGAFFFIISSHGGEGDVVYGTDGKAVAVQELKKRYYATNCHSLAGIPKVFVIDACRGIIKEPALQYTTKAFQSSLLSSTTSFMDSADIMTIFASARGNAAGCNEKGSFFIQKFVRVLKKHATKMNLTDMMKKVKRKIEKLQVQTPHVESSFSKDYYIQRDRQDEEEAHEEPMEQQDAANSEMISMQASFS